MHASPRIRALIWVSIFLGALAFGDRAHADKRVAMVIANSAYQKSTKLVNPSNDGAAIAAMLRQAGFQAVTLHENLTIRDMRRVVREFSDASRDADIAVTYYSGHGIEVSGTNYLVPVDAALERDMDVPYEAYSLDHLMQSLEPVRKLRLVILDACRDNPFGRVMKRTVGSRGTGNGLAPVEPTSSNTLIAYAAKAGSVAMDGDGKNSPYTAALLKVLPTPDLDLRIAFGRVRDEVLRTTQSKQEPFLYGSLGGTELALVQKITPAAVEVPTPPPAPRAPDYQKEIELSFWTTVRESKSKEMLGAYLERYPNGEFAALARVLMRQLETVPDRPVETSKVAPTRPPALPSPPPPPQKATVVALEVQPALPSTDLAPKTVNGQPEILTSLAKDVQAELKRVGCLRAEPDGVWGPQTKSAVEEFAKAKSLPVDSKAASPELLAALKEQNVQVCVAKPDASATPPPVAARPVYRTAPRAAASVPPPKTNCRVWVSGVTFRKKCS